ncbi:MAG: aminotransferase class I/II-fold pyridoxal phosphate-dependent enzyme [Bacteroidales bacterium]|jgi:glycine C-acetyltransferase|nr:aminotransferase class I/II-fold pyridoxal phosphate-dependent enzyme [Bacteroidales bacterium]
MDLFDKLKVENSAIGKFAADSEGYYLFPKLEGQLGPRMNFLGKERLNWSLNNYLGLGNHPEVRKADADAAKEWGMAYPMGARMLSGHTKYHEQLENELAAFVKKESAYLLNYGYQGMVSIIDAMVDRHDVVVYDSEAHACIIDGMRLHIGKRFVYPHNDIENLEKQLQRATKLTDVSGGGILLITEGVYGMTGGLGHLKDIVALKKKYNFRILIDDAHGFGTMGEGGRGTHVHYDVADEIDVYFGTFAKSMAGIGGFVAGNAQVVQYLKYSMRSQIYAKSLPMPMVIGALKRLDMIRTRPELLKKLWTIVNAMQKGLRDAGFNIGQTESMVTPVILAGGVTDATQVTYDLRENYNIFCSIVTYPVVPKGIILLRIIPTADHSLENVEYTIQTFKEIQRKLTNKEYDNELKSMNVK